MYLVQFVNLCTLAVDNSMHQLALLALGNVRFAFKGDSNKTQMRFRVLEQLGRVRVKEQ